MYIYNELHQQTANVKNRFYNEVVWKAITLKIFWTRLIWSGLFYEGVTKGRANNSVIERNRGIQIYKAWFFRKP